MFISKKELNRIKYRISSIEDSFVYRSSFEQLRDEVRDLRKKVALLEGYLNIEVTTTPPITKYEPIVQRDTPTT